MTAKRALASLTAEILQLESETFEIADYAEANELLLVTLCVNCSSTSCTSCTG